MTRDDLIIRILGNEDGKEVADKVISYALKHPDWLDSLELPLEFPKDTIADVLWECEKRIWGRGRETYIGKNKKKEIAITRHVLIYLYRKFSGKTVVEVGKFVGRKHPDVCYVLSGMNVWKDQEPYRTEIARFTNLFNQLWEN